MIIEKFDPFNIMVSIPLHQVKILTEYLRSVLAHPVVLSSFENDTVIALQRAGYLQYNTLDVDASVRSAVCVLGAVSDKIFGSDNAAKAAGVMDGDKEEGEKEPTVH